MNDLGARDESASGPGARAEHRSAARPLELTFPASLAELSGRYDAVLCDLWGVVHDGRRVFEPAAAALRAFRARGGRVVLISNVPKPRGVIPRQLERLGLARDAWDALVTSGDATRAEFAARAPGPMHLFGPRSDSILWDGLGIELATLEHASFIGATGLDDFDVETPADYSERLRHARERGLTMVCANPDIVVRLGERLHWCAGALARDYAQLGGQVVMCGKPHAPIYQLALRELLELTGREPERARVLAIGDGLTTDVMGANREGLQALFVASGIHGASLHERAGLDRDKVEAALREARVHARYAMRELA